MNMEPITIRKAELSDLTRVQQIGRETFFETFAQANTEADMQTYLKENFSDAKVSAELSHPILNSSLPGKAKLPLGI